MIITKHQDEPLQLSCISTHGCIRNIYFNITLIYILTYKD